jgi:hypothetical protein
VAAVAVAAIKVSAGQPQQTAATVVQAQSLFLTPVRNNLAAVQSRHPVETQSIRSLRRAR